MSDLHVVTPSSEPTAEMYNVTPAVAKRWLSRNVRNRNVRKNVVAGYARDMKSSAWKITGEAIKFDTNGALADGQHRLHAVILSGATVTMLVVRGVEPEAQAVMDSGSRRSAADALTFAGHKHAPILASAATLALREPLAGFSESRVPNPTKTEMATFIQAHPRLAFAAERAQHFYPDFDAPPSVLTVAWLRFEEQAGVAATAEFFESVANSVTDGSGDPRLALIRRLAAARRNRERMEQKAFLSLIYRTWNAWRDGVTVKRLHSEVRGESIKIPEAVAS